VSLNFKKETVQKMTKLYLLIYLFLLSSLLHGQIKVAITIDDVPNTRIFEESHYQSGLLSVLDSLNIPVAIFINEGYIYKTDLVTRNFALLNEWVKRDYISLGNHTFSHSRYSEVGFDEYVFDIQKGEAMTKELAKLYRKPLNYFRFTYNDLGKDSVQRQQIEDYLSDKNYKVAPFTIESSDWIFNYLYEYYLSKNKVSEAKRIANTYLEVTLDYFHYFNSLAIDQYGRAINQIYLCHNNALNSDCLPSLIKRLTADGYEIVSLDEAMCDKVYDQKNHYNKKWGISWFYRWMNNDKEIQTLMKNEPGIMNIYKEYQEVQKLEN